MTREQYYEMAQNFAEFAGKKVPYKSLNHYYYFGYGEISKHKYNHYQGILVGVGVGGNSEHFILQRDYGRVCIHYTNITWPR